MTLLLLIIIYLAFISLGLPDSLLGAAWPVMQPDLGAPLETAGFLFMTIAGGTIISSLISGKVLKKLLHAAVISPTGIGLKWTDNPYIFALYAGLAAGVFEEVGRFVGLKWFLKGKKGYGDGLSLGIGHGGIEALLIGAFAGVYSIIFAHMINTGTLPDVSAQVSTADIDEIKQHFIDQGFWTYFIAGIERVVAVTIHLFLSLVVLLAIKRNAFKYVIYAILLHTVFDIVPALYQAQVIPSLWITETIIIIFGILAGFMIFKMRALYFEETE